MTIAKIFPWRATRRRGRIKRTDATKRVPPNGKLRYYRFSNCIAGALLLLTTGCDLHDFIHWSPDGQHAFVQGNDGTWLIGSSSKILGKATDARATAPPIRITSSPSAPSNPRPGMNTPSCWALTKLTA